MSFIGTDPGAMELVIGGQRFTGWERGSVKRGIERAASSFAFTVSERWGEADAVAAIAPFDTAVVTLGGAPILTGYVDGYHSSLATGQHVVTISGRSRTEDVVDCTPDLAGGQFNGYTLDAIARTIGALFGVGVVVQAPMGDAFPQVAMQPHETGFRFLERLARLRGVLLTDDGNGNLVLTTASAATATDTLEEGRNVQRGSVSLSSRGRFSLWRVKTQTPAITAPASVGVLTSLPANPTAADRVANSTSSLATAPQTANNPAVLGEAMDAGVPRYRPHVVAAESGLTQAQAAERAAWEARHAAGRSTSVEVEVMGWHQRDGSLWQPNMLVSVQIPTLHLELSLLIAECEWAMAPGTGRTTRMKLGPVDGFSADPGQVRVRRNRAKGGRALDQQGVITSLGS
ncbi:MAG: hypothetical protein KGN77_01845 [Xanthomonadaceae bacterium]|nr:hypothetical protein [Xanthomonadaceae bacterium]